MPVIGIISVPMKRKSLHGRLLNRVTIKESFGESPKYIVAETFSGAEDIAKMSAVRLRLLINKAKKILKASGAEVVLFSSEFKLCAGEKYNCEAEKSCKIPRYMLPECFRFAAELAARNKPFGTLTVSDEALSLVSYEFLAQICCFAKSITVCTSCICEAEAIAERIFTQYGVYVTVKSGTAQTISVSQAVIDADLCTVRVNDFILDKAEFYSNSGEYQTDSAEEAAFLGERNNLKIKNWISGKNIIKMS